MTKKNAAIQNGEKTLKAEISVNYLIQREAKENETAKQLKKRIEIEKRAATNEARKLLARDIKGGLGNLKIIEEIFSNPDLSRPASEVFLSKLSDEVGKKISVEDVLKIPKRDLLDYVKEIEEARGIIRGGINPTEYTNIIARYYRGIKAGAITDKDALLRAYNQQF